MQMNIKNVKTVTGSDDSSSEAATGNEADEYFSYPVYFTHCVDGSITDVTTNEDDPEESSKMKVGILFGLRTSINSQSNGDYVMNTVIDTVGQHAEYTKTEFNGGRTIVSSYYSEDDFLHFADENMQSREIVVDGSNVRELDGTHLSKSTSVMKIVFNPMKKNDNGEGAGYTIISANGEQTLSGFQQGNDENVDFPFETVEAFLAANPSLKPMTIVSPEEYASREIKRDYAGRTQRNVKRPDDSEDCPTDTTCCKTFNVKWVVGDEDCGFVVDYGVFIAVLKGCSVLQRKYPFGTSMGIEVNVMSEGEKTYASEMYFEYGQHRKGPYKQTLEISLFGEMLYNGLMPENCGTTDVVTLKEYTKGIGFYRWIWIFVLQLKYQKVYTVKTSATVEYDLCLANVKTKFAYYPKFTYTAKAAHEASVGLARAGIELKGTIVDNWKPQFDSDIQTCTFNARLVHEQEPYQSSLVGWYQTRVIKGWSLKWGTKHTHTFWSHSKPGKTEVLHEASYNPRNM
eukprot:MONOS_4346.1-p1 / transcript=MONOS_4346.1 / gene=MONOS_4346 / organism=Monocercomonoides_exilis_PA203 / gene_product=unspecified product / transcript_product=unspecified product / location=Mono_scaffold00114:78942-80566(+) / protein_length=513 / sequence_SO=supercontig / SO=protein_coding / is_pseudo=false